MTEYVGNDLKPKTTIDLVPVSFGTGTFQNPFFWMMVGIIGTIAAQHLLNKRRTN